MKITDKALQQKILTDPNSFSNQQCFTKCVLFSTGMIDKNGFVTTETEKKIAEKIKISISDQQKIKCHEYASKGKNACEVSDMSIRCFLKITAQTN